LNRNNTAMRIVPKKGDILLGKVISVGDKISTILVSALMRNHGPLAPRPLPRTTHAYIFIRDVGYPCVRLGDMLKIGDLVLGLVKIDWFKPVFISFEGDILGVVAAKCSNCGAIIPTPKDYNRLICPNCKNIRETKISVLYEPLLWSEIHKRYRIHIYPPVQ